MDANYWRIRPRTILYQRRKNIAADALSRLEMTDTKDISPNNIKLAEYFG